MFFKDATKKCQVVRQVTDNGIRRCLKPATVILIRNMADATVVCPDCARALAIEILDSVPGGRLDVDVLTSKRRVRG